MTGGAFFGVGTIENSLALLKMNSWRYVAVALQKTRQTFYMPPALGQSPQSAEVATGADIDGRNAFGKTFETGKTIAV